MRTADHPSWAARNKILLLCDVALNLLRRFYIKAARKSFQQACGFLSLEGELDEKVLWLGGTPNGYRYLVGS